MLLNQSDQIIFFHVFTVPFTWFVVNLKWKFCQQWFSSLHLLWTMRNLRGQLVTKVTKARKPQTRHVYILTISIPMGEQAYILLKMASSPQTPSAEFVVLVLTGDNGLLSLLGGEFELLATWVLTAKNILLKCGSLWIRLKSVSWGISRAVIWCFFYGVKLNSDVNKMMSPCF